MFARLSNMFAGNNENSSTTSSQENIASSTSDTCAKNATGNLCQIDNSRTVLEKIAGLYAEKLMSDIILRVGKKEFPAHRLILCASSDVFQVMLMNPQWNESREQRIVLQEAPECLEVFEMFLKYLYTGRIKVSHTNVLPILALADKYNVRDLIATCGCYMNNNLVSAAKQDHLISWLQYTLSSGHDDVATACINYFKWNFEQVAETNDFATCDVNLLTMILSHHDLVIQDEMTLYTLVVCWLKKQEERLSNNTPLSTPMESPSFIPSQPSPFMSPTTTPTTPFFPPQPSITPSKEKMYIRRTSACSSNDYIDQLEFLTYEVMKYVRFPMMTPRQLADLLLVPLTIRFKEFFVTRMAIGMSFHSGQWERIKEVLSEPDQSNKLLFTPRLYTAEQWSAGLTVNNLPGLPSYQTRTLVFNTPASASELENESQLEWIVELYPKGVLFKRFYLIVWQGTIEVPEVVLRTVRLAVTAKEVEYARVRIAVLVYGLQDSIEHVKKVVTTNHIFTYKDNLLNLDDILPFDTFTDPADWQEYLLDPCSSLKIHIVISPLSDPSTGLTCIS